jgi:hypothetical protein
MEHVSAFKKGLVALTCTSVRFLDVKWTKVLSPSFAIINVPSAIRNKPHETKIKGVKIRGDQNI